ncbi:hypothetical protein EJB05_33723, partial [Eragrostis curvula]
MERLVEAVRVSCPHGCGPRPAYYHYRDAHAHAPTSVGLIVSFSVKLHDGFTFVRAVSVLCCRIHHHYSMPPSVRVFTRTMTRSRSQPQLTG